MANALSLGRLLLAVPFGWLMLRPDAESAGYAAALFCLAILSDLLDGPLARRRGTVSPLGGTLDHGADFVFVTAGLSAMAWRAVVPWLLPLLVVLAFTQYVIDSRQIEGRLGLSMSAIGRYNGILYFVPAGVDIAVRLGWAALAGPTRWIAWLLVATTLISMGDRWLARSRRAPGSPGAERSGRSQR